MLLSSRYLILFTMVNVFPDPAPATTKVFSNDLTASNCFSQFIEEL